MSRPRTPALVTAAVLVAVAGCTAANPSARVRPPAATPDLGATPPTPPGSPAPSPDLGTPTADLATSPPPQDTFAITGLSSTSLHVGDQLTVFGVNFSVPSERNAVSIDATYVPPSAFAATSNAQQLVLTIPPVGSLGPSGQMVTLRISNDHGFDQRSFFLAPPVPTKPSGNLVVSLSQWLDAASPVASGRSVLAFRIRALTDVADTYTLTATTTLPGATATAADASNAPRPTIQLSPVNASDAGVEVHLLLDVPAGASGSGAVALSVVSQKNPALVGLSGLQPFTIGSAPPSPGDIAFTIGGALPSSSAGIDGDGVHVPPGGTAVITLVLVMPASAADGAYDIVGPTIGGDAAHWTATNTSGPSFLWQAGGQMPRASFSLQPAASAAPSTVTLHIQPHAGAGASADITLPLRAM